MDELYSKEDDAPRKVNLNAEEPAPTDVYYEYTKALKKVPKYTLHNELNKQFTDDARRKAKILARLNSKKIKL